jgi:hypothetical protein
VTALVLALYLAALAAGGVAVWRRPLVALYAFVVGLALHNAVMAALFSLGLRGGELTLVAAWKEALLAVAVARVVADAVRARALPFRPRLADALALAFAAVVVAYALVPQDALGGAAGAEAVLHGLRHALLPVVAYGLGRSLALGSDDLRRLGWTIVGVAAVVAGAGLVELWSVSVERWRAWEVPAYFRDQLGFDYHGPGGMPENFAFNSDEGLFRRLVSIFVSPLATAFALAVALLVAGAWPPLRRRLTVPLAGLIAVGLLFTLSRSTLVALAGAFVVLAFALRRAWPVAAAAATLAVGAGFALAYPSLAPETHFFPEELAYQEEQARLKGGLPEGGGTLSPSEPSIESHWTNLVDGAETVLGHPQGYGLGNAGAVAQRNDVELLAGESNYTELGVETGLAGLALFVAWSLAVLAGLLRTARAGDPYAAGVAAAFALVLALGVQTDAFGVPWLAYCVWWLSGSALSRAAPAAEKAEAPAAARLRTSHA